MNVIKQNPFRIIGLTGNASERELQKQIGIIKRFAEIGKSKSSDYDFDFIGDFSRSLEDVQKAVSRIEQSKKKLHYSLFWFVRNNNFDDIALSNLKSQNIEKAKEIWGKTLKEEVTSKNYSSYLNLSTLSLALASNNGQLNVKEFQRGIDLAGQLIYSDSIKEYSKLVTGNGLSTNSEEICKNYIDDIIELLDPYLNKSNGLSNEELIALFDSYPNEIKIYISSKFTEVPISNIENNLEQTILKRKDNPRDAANSGENLFLKTREDLKVLKKVLGEENIQYQMLVNKLANEILQCSIDFFNIFRNEDSGFDPGDDAVKVAMIANSLGATGQTRDRIAESLEVIKEWVDDKPTREVQEAVSEDIAFITQKLTDFEDLSATVENAKSLIISCTPYLKNIKNELGVSNDFYIQISSAVVSYSLGMTIDVVNREQSKLQYDRTKIITLPLTISSALAAVNIMGSLDMDPATRSRYNTNKNTISSINSQLQSYTQRSSGSKSSSGGCYIATMVYGDYDHPQVLILRKFRDEVLLRTISGKIFIKIYYSISPKLVSLLKNRKRVTAIIRRIIDKLIIYIK